MIYKNSNQEGITLISLIATIIIMLILASIGISYGIDSYRMSQMMKFISEMQVLQEKVDLIVQNGENINFGSSITGNTRAISALNNASENNEIEEYQASRNAEYKYLSISDIANYLDVDNATSDIVVNFTTREVISIGGISYKTSVYYTQYLLPGGHKIIKQTPTTRTLSNIQTAYTVNGLNATVSVSGISITNGTLMFKMQGQDSWTNITNYTNANEQKTFTISKSGTYIVRLVDNTNTTNYNETQFSIVLTNAPKLETGMTLTNDTTYNYSNFSTSATSWARATMNSKNYIWIPRYAYDSEDNIKFSRGNSTIATDETFLDDETWTVPDKFGVNDTGIWVEITASNQNNLLDLINDNS